MKLFETPTNIKAAKASADYRGIERLLAAAGVAEIVKPLTIQEIDLAFAGSPLSTSQRIACKSALSRVGLLK